MNSSAAQSIDAELAESRWSLNPTGERRRSSAASGPFDLSSAGGRRRLYALIVAGLFVLAWTFQAVKSHKSHEPLDFVVTDAEGYWVYMPSLVLDGNLDFRRQILWHSGVHPIDSYEFPQTPLGMCDHWPTGVAMTLAPAFLAGHALSLAFHHFTTSSLIAPNGYSLLYQFLCVGMVMLLGWCMLAAADDVLTRRFHVPGRAIAAGAVVYALGSSWAYYLFREPFMAHAIAAAWVMFTILLADRISRSAAEGRVVWWHWPAIVFTFSMSIICRTTNVVTLIVIAWPLIVTLRAGLFTKALKYVPLMILAAFPIVLQLITWHILAPRNAIVGGGMGGYRASEVFHWAHPALWQTMLSSNHGLFFWSPVLLLGVWGYAHRIARQGASRDGFLIALPLTFAALWYINSSWYAWWFGKAFGARAFIDFSGIFIIGLAFGFDWMMNLSPGWRRLARASVWAAMIFNWLLLAAFITYLIPRQSALIGQRIGNYQEPPTILLRPTTTSF